MLVNLIENAIRYCPPGTRICVETGLTPDKGALLIVSDTGPGIPAADREDVLKPFVRLDASRASPGSGLGLALVNAIAARHDASVCLEDNAPGLRVVVRFPPVTAGVVVSE